LTSFIGRDREVEAILDLVHQAGIRIVTLTGPGGVGKTRLAQRVARKLGQDLSEVVTVIYLASVADPALVLPTIAQSLAVREADDQPLVERLSMLLGDRRMFLLLDNLEHLTHAVPDLAALLVACPGMTILATSRVVLRISGEQVFPVLPLGFPREHGSPDPGAIARLEAVALFVERARAADPDFSLTCENAVTIAEIVRRLDGLPLAIELAASRVRALTPEALLSRLSDRLTLLTGGPRDLPDRQRTMRDTIAWSFDLLSPAEQVCFRRLAVFAGAFTLPAAEAVGGVESREETIDLVGSLVDQSLLRKQADAGGEPRYLTLETVREYGLEQLVLAGEEAETRQRHADYYVALLESITPSPRWPATPARVRLIDAERDNLRAVLAWLDAVGDAEHLLHMILRLWVLWATFGQVSEGRRWFSRILEHGDALSPFVRGMALGNAGTLATFQGDGERALRLIEEGLELVETVADPTLDDRFEIALMMRQYGFTLLTLGHYEEAESWVERSLTTFRELGSEENVAGSRHMLASAAYGRGNLTRAQELYEATEAQARATGSAGYIASALDGRALVSCARGDYAQAANAIDEAFAQGALAGIYAGPPRRLAIVAVVATGAGEYESAARWFGAADIVAQMHGTPFALPDGPQFEGAIATVRAALGEDRFVAAWTAGRALTHEEAVSQARSFLAASYLVPDSAGGGAPDPGKEHILTHREMEVLQLVADGRSDRDIADTLFIGPSTVRTHLTSIFAKLDVNSRTAAVAAARRRGIL
jgi:predicted ATPase/DNA-binding CsgD family transcriptional regulator